MTYDNALRRWREPPLALQITALLLAGLVVAQLATLMLTLLLPPDPPRQYELEDIAKALLEGEDGTRSSRLTSTIRMVSPQPGGPGWLTSERSRRDLAQLLGRDESGVRLFFFTPLPFAGTASVPPRPTSRAMPDFSLPRENHAMQHTTRYIGGLMRTDYQMAQAGGGRGGGMEGGGGGGGGSGSSGWGGQGGGFGAPSGFGGPGGAWESRGGGGRDAGPLLDGGQEGFRSASPMPSGNAQDVPAATSTIPTSPAAAQSRPDAQREGQSQTVPDPSTKPPAMNPSIAGGASPPTAIAAPPFQVPKVRGQGSSLAAPAVPSVNIRLPTPVRQSPISPPGPMTSSQPNAVTSSVSPTTESRIRSPSIESDAATVSRPLLPQEPALPQVPILRKSTVPSRGNAPTDRSDVDGVPSTRGLFGLAPAPFVQGDFIAALQRPKGDWMVVQPVPEPFPNAWQRRVLLWFVVALLLVAPAGWWFSRRLVRPIVGFARAAEQLGRDPRASVLVMQGPAEVGRAALALNGMQSRLRNFVEDRTAMIGAISHDLRTPLTRMRFRIEDVPDEVRAGMLDDVEEMEQMISSVLSFLRDASEPGSREQLDLLSIVEDVVEDARFVGKDVRLERSEHVTVEVDAIGIRRVLNNLIENAVKYGDQARLRLFVDKLDAVAEISDSGPGLPSNELTRVFQPFYRDLNARRSGKQGSGLGLAVCRSIARAHGGDVRLSSGPRGLIAQLRVPLFVAA